MAVAAGFFLLDALVILKSKQRIVFGYVAVCWLFLGFFYFNQCVSQVYTFAHLMGVAFMLQGLGLLVLTICMRTSMQTDRPQWIIGCGYLLFAITALMPYSYVLENTQASFMLFGWGAEQTALGTLALLVIGIRRKVECLLVIILVFWLVFSIVAL